MNTIVVTGAGSGVGRAIARKFAAEGWQVALVGRRRAPLDDTARLIAADASVLAVPCDVSQADAVEAMRDTILRQFGHVDVLVNSAGINVPARALAVLSVEDWRHVLSTNLDGAFYCVRAFLPSMRQRGRGTIVNINSDVGKRARDLAGAAYVSSKFGLRGLTQQINAEERAHGIRACSILPRDVNTPLLDKRPAPPPDDVRARMIQPDDLAACVWLVATLPNHVILDEISLETR